MARFSFSLSLKRLFTRHPVLANRLQGVMGARGVERIARRNAIRAARRAYDRVPYYRTLFEQHGFDARRMGHLTWDDFARLPTSSKVAAESVPDKQLLDHYVPSPAGDALLGRSSGTTSGPAIWPTGWEEFILTRDNLWRMLREIEGNRTRTALLIMFAIDGGDLAGNLPFRAGFSLKERTRWPFEVFAAGEEPNAVIAILRWLAREGYETLFLMSFPGTWQRLLDRLAELEGTDPAAGVEWARFKRIRIGMGGQTPAAQLRQRIRHDLRRDPMELREALVYASSDAGQLVAQSTPFTLWLERYLQEHPELYEMLGLTHEHRTKPLMECVTPLAVYFEQDEEGTLLLTTWKHRPLIRYRTNDLVWLRPARDVVRLLDKHGRGWRRDYARFGYGRGTVPHATCVTMILGRSDDVRIVNGANISPELLREALEVSGILPLIHHFKHDTDDARPNAYDVYLELPDRRDPDEYSRLAAEWQPRLLQALIQLPGGTDVSAAHRSNPIELRLFVRGRGEAEFAGDAGRAKLSYVLRR